MQWNRAQLVSMRMRFDPWPCSVGQGVAGSCGVGHKMWLGWSVAVAVALVGTVASIRPLAWELPFAVALKKKQTKKQTKKKK